MFGNVREVGWSCLAHPRWLMRSWCGRSYTHMGTALDPGQSWSVAAQTVGLGSAPSRTPLVLRSNFSPGAGEELFRELLMQAGRHHWDCRLWI